MGTAEELKRLLREKIDYFDSNVVIYLKQGRLKRTIRIKKQEYEMYAYSCMLRALESGKNIESALDKLEQELRELSATDYVGSVGWFNGLTSIKNYLKTQ